MEKTEIVAKLIALATEITTSQLEDIFEQVESVEHAQTVKEAGGSLLGKVFRRPYTTEIATTIMLNSFEGGEYRGFRADSDGDIYPQSAAFNCEWDWKEVTDRDTLAELAHKAFKHFDVKEGDYITVYTCGQNIVSSSDPAVVKVDRVTTNGLYPSVEGDYFTVETGQTVKSDVAILFPAVFRPSTEEEIALHKKKFPEAPTVIHSASGLELKVGDCVYSDIDEEIAVITKIVSANSYAVLGTGSDFEVEEHHVSVDSYSDRRLRRATVEEKAVLDAVIALDGSRTVK